MFLDPKNPDWIAAEQAVKEISELMPLIVQGMVDYSHVFKL